MAHLIGRDWSSSEIGSSSSSAGVSVLSSPPSVSDATAVSEAFATLLSISAMLKSTLIVSLPNLRVSATSSCPSLSSMLHVPVDLKLARNSGSSLGLTLSFSYCSSLASLSESPASPFAHQEFWTSRSCQLLCFALVGDLMCSLDVLSPWLHLATLLERLRFATKTDEVDARLDAGSLGSVEVSDREDAAARRVAVIAEKARRYMF